MEQYSNLAYSTPRMYRRSVHSQDCTQTWNESGFADLLNAYDIADHKLLIKILEQYGAQSNVCSVVETVYMTLTVIIKRGTSMTEILQCVVVRQGDNMLSVL